MRHYLNTTLKGKQDDLGLNYYSVYYMFSVSRQTFKIKSRILNKQLREDQFEQMFNSKNKLLAKDQQIIEYCIEKSTFNGMLDVDHFKSVYQILCTSLILWYEDLIRNERGKIMDDFFYGADVEETNSKDILSDLEKKYKIDRRIVLNYLNRYSIYNQNNFNRYIIVYDWSQLNLRSDFMNYLNNTDIPSEHSELMGFIDELISLI